MNDFQADNCPGIDADHVGVQFPADDCVYFGYSSDGGADIRIELSEAKAQELIDTLETALD